MQSGRGDRAERALHRVGGFYDRIGNLILHGLIDENEARANRPDWTCPKCSGTGTVVAVQFDSVLHA